MPDPGQETKAAKKVVAKAFKGIDPEYNESIPPSLAENRRKRAEQRLIDAVATAAAPVVAAAIPGAGPIAATLVGLVADWAKRGFEDSFEKVEKFEIDCAQEGLRNAAEATGDEQTRLDYYEKDYRRKVIERYGVMELKGLQTQHSIPLDLDEIYVPLHVQPQAAPDEDPVSQINDILAPQSRVTIDDTLRENPRIVLIGSPGSGKTTLISWLACQMARGQLDSVSKKTLPFLVLVRSYSDKRLDTKAISELANVEEELVRSAFDEGRACLLIDGLDEANVQRRKSLTTSLARLGKSHPKLRMVVTSRPTGIDSTISFPTFCLSDFDKEDVEHFVRMWCIAAEKSAQIDPDVAKRKGEKAAEDLNGSLRRNSAVQKIASNPLLASVLCVVHRFLGQRIPERRVVLYEKCTDALLYEWDKAKPDSEDLNLTLDAGQKRRLLIPLARSLHEKHESQASEEMVRDSFAKNLPELGESADRAGDLVAEIRDRSGLLVTPVPGMFAFSHLTFQEYLTALDLADRSDIKILLKHALDPWWREVVVLWSGLPGVPVNQVLLQLLKRSDMDSILLAVQCCQAALEVDVELRDQVHERLIALNPMTNEEVSKIVSLGPVAGPLFIQGLDSDNRLTNFYSLIGLLELQLTVAVSKILHLIKRIERYRIGTNMGELSEWTLRGVATCALAGIAMEGQSHSGSRAFSDALNELDSDEINLLPRLLPLRYFKENPGSVTDSIKESLQASLSETSSSKQPRRTGKARPSKPGKGA